ncbi:MAG: hypothetical protein JWQ49_6541 [Edaphobacter sp.]|nr:hypothetical protein [Edaphobacter sp.]
MKDPHGRVVYDDPMPLLKHDFDLVLHRPEDTFDIGVDDVIVVLVRQLGEWR